MNASHINESICLTRQANVFSIKSFIDLGIVRINLIGLRSLLRNPHGSTGYLYRKNVAPLGLVPFQVKSFTRPLMLKKMAPERRVFNALWILP